MAQRDHDSLYHLLFSHPGVVAQLLRGFAADIALGDFELEGMERLNTKFHAATGHRREGDMIWRIPRKGGGEAYLVLLLEFQSTSDYFMALRVLAYAALLWQQLVREKRLMEGAKLPPLLPVVLFNGRDGWRAPFAVRELVGLEGEALLWRWQPDILYHLIDISAFSAAELEQREGLPALWFRLENADGPDETVAVLDDLLAWLDVHPGFSAARAAFVALLRAMIAPVGAGVRVPADLLEVRNMLATRSEQWVQNWLREGEEKGRRLGRQEGLRQGEASMLLRLLQRRFGVLPGWATERVTSADSPALEEWSLRILDAGRLEDVVGDPPG
jgi:hypothetical protein